MQNLLREGISIRDLVTIFETLADNATSTRDTDVLTEYVRQSLKRAISNKYFPPNEMTSVVTLDPKIEQEIMGSIKQTEQGTYINLEPDDPKVGWRGNGKNGRIGKKSNYCYIADRSALF